MAKDIHASKKLSQPQKAQRNSLIDEEIQKNIELNAAEVLELINPRLAKKGLPETCYSNVFTRKQNMLAKSTEKPVDSIKEQLKMGTKPVVQLKKMEQLIGVMKEHGFTEVVMKTDEGPMVYRLEES